MRRLRHQLSVIVHKELRRVQCRSKNHLHDLLPLLRTELSGIAVIDDGRLLIIDHDIVLVKIRLVKAGFKDTLRYPLLGQRREEALTLLQIRIQLPKLHHRSRTFIRLQLLQALLHLLEVVAHCGAAGLLQHQGIGLRAHQRYQTLALHRVITLVVDDTALDILCLQAKVQLLLIYLQLSGNGLRHALIGILGALQEEGLLALHPVLYIRTQQLNDCLPAILLERRTVDPAEEGLTHRSGAQGTLH